MEKINYTLTLEDCNKYARSQNKIPRLKKYLAKHYLKIGLKFIVFLIVLSIIFVGIAIHDICINDKVSLLSLIPKANFHRFLLLQTIFQIQNIIIFTIILFLILNFQRYFYDGKVIYKMQAGIDLNYELSISEENITRTNKNGVSMFNWETIKDIYDTKYNYLIFTSDLQAIIIPKRCFENEEEGKNFYNNIQKYYNAVQKW